MPKVIHGLHGEGIEVPSLPRDEWLRRLEAIVGRPLTEEETAKANRMGDHNWTLRVVAGELWGDAAADAHFDPKD
jgi:hypothetical protein